MDFGEGTLTYTQAKTGEKVTIVIHPDLLAHLDKLASTDKPEAFIMPDMAGLKPGGRHGLSEGFKRIMRKAGVDLQTVKGVGRDKAVTLAAAFTLARKMAEHIAANAVAVARGGLAWFCLATMGSLVYVTKGATMDYIFSLSEPAVAILAAGELGAWARRGRGSCASC